VRPYVDAHAKTGQSGVAAIGVAQEYQNVFASTERQGSNGLASLGFFKADRRVTCFYFYVWDVDFGPAFIKVCAYFPYRSRSGSTDTSGPNAKPPMPGSGSPRYPTGSPPVRTRSACRRSATGSEQAPIKVFFQRWMSILPLPLPLTDHDRSAGYWWELSVRQIEVSRTIVFDVPRHARRSSRHWSSTTSTSAGPTAWN